MAIRQSAMAVGQLSNPTLAFSNPVLADNVLVAAHFGAGFGAPPQAGIASAVSDSVNGSWGAARHASGNQADGANHNWELAWWLLTSTGAGTPTVTFTATAGQNGSTVIIAELDAGTLNVAGSADAITGDGLGNCTTPQPSTGASAGDAVYALLGGYVPQSATAPVTTGWTARQNSDSGGAATGTAAGMVCDRSRAATAGERPQMTASGYFAGATGWAGITFTITPPSGGGPAPVIAATGSRRRRLWP